MDEDTVGFLPPPELTHLTLEVHTRDTGYRSLTVSFLVNVRQTLIDDFEAAAHDAVLRHAHAAGHMPVGPILIRIETWSPAEQGPLKEGKPILRSMEEMALENEGRAGNIVQVLADVELGLSL